MHIPIMHTPMSLTGFLPAAAISLAVWRGSREAVALAAVELAFLIKQNVAPWPPNELFLANGLTDAFVLSVSVWCLLKGQAYWLIWAGSARLLELANDLMLPAMPRLSLWAWGATDLFWYWLFMLLLLYGALAPTPKTARQTSALLFV
jgi:hypothetical protein